MKFSLAELLYAFMVLAGFLAVGRSLISGHESQELRLVLAFAAIFFITVGCAGISHCAWKRNKS
jgi:hypothetical protein